MPRPMGQPSHPRPQIFTVPPSLYFAIFHCNCVPIPLTWMLLKIDFTSYKCLGLVDIDQRGAAEVCNSRQRGKPWALSSPPLVGLLSAASIYKNYVYAIQLRSWYVWLHSDSPGSVVVKFRIAWEFKEGIRKAPDPVDKDAVRQRLERQLNLNGGTLGTYHVSLGSIRASR
jgi:hypothetical protein